MDTTEKIDYVEDSIGRRFVFYYTPDYLIGIYAVTADGERIENIGVVYRFNMDKLQGVIYGYNDHNSYGYSGSRLISVTDIDGCGRVTRCELQNISADAGNYTTVCGYTNTYDFYTNEDGKEVYDEKTKTKYYYSYDEYGNIVCEEIYTVNSNQTEILEEKIIYEYDGMILTKSRSSLYGITRYTTNSVGSVTAVSYPGGVLNFSWGEGRRLKAIRDAQNNMFVNYTYNEEGLRIKKSISSETKATTEYVWGKNGLAGFTTEEDTVVVHYGQDGTPVGFSFNDMVYTYIKNIQGDVLRILDTNGSTVVEYSYDPWGVPIASWSCRFNE